MSKNQKLDLDRPRSSQSVDLGGRGPGPSGDSTTVQTNNNADLDLEWTEIYTPVNIYFDDRHCGPRNVLPNINGVNTKGFHRTISRHRILGESDSND